MNRVSTAPDVQMARPASSSTSVIKTFLRHLNSVWEAEPKREKGHYLCYVEEAGEYLSEIPCKVTKEYEDLSLAIHFLAESLDHATDHFSGLTGRKSDVGGSNRWTGSDGRIYGVISLEKAKNYQEWLLAQW